MNNMLVGEKGVKYGLQVRQVPQSTKPAQNRKQNVFGDEGDTDDEHDNVEKQISRQAARIQSDKKITEMHEEALKEDAAIFDYDTHYDAIQEARSAPKRQEKLTRQSRYIGSLLEKAEERKREQEVLYERRLVKELEAEDYLFGNKERFVTEAYKKKMEEDAKVKAQLKRKQEEEERNAVEKRGHMGDFYRNLLRDNVAFGNKSESSANGNSGPRHAKDSGLESERPLAPSVTRTATMREGDDSIMPERRREVVNVVSTEKPAARIHAESKAFEPMESEIDAARTTEDDQAKGPSERLQRKPSPGDASNLKGRSRDDTVAAARERYLARKRKAGDV